MLATRVRRQRVVRQPVPTVQWTIGDHQPTALALAAPGLLGPIAAAMGKNVTTLEKWAQGERGPEPDLRALFFGLLRVGVPRARAALIPETINAQFDATYAADLPELSKLHKMETVTDLAEDDSQMDCVLSHDELDRQACYLPVVLADIAMRRTVAARLTRNLQAAGRL